MAVCEKEERHVAVAFQKHSCGNDFPVTKVTIQFDIKIIAKLNIYSNTAKLDTINLTEILY